MARGRVLSQEKQLWFSPEESSLSLPAARCWASWMTFRVTDKSLWNQRLKKRCLRIAQAASFPPVFWDVTGPYAGLVVKSVLRLSTDMWALTLAGIWDLASGSADASLAKHRCCRCGRQPASLPQFNQAALTSCTRGGLSGMLLKRLGCYVRRDCDLFFFSSQWIFNCSKLRDHNSSA